MNFPLYDSMRKLIQKPHDRYISDLQALINDRWENSTQTIFDILMETQIGSKIYEPIEISVDTAVDIGTGFKKGDDFKVFSFRDITLEIPIGTMFKTDMDYWLCVNSNGYASPTNSCEVRRCNNVMKWIDPSNGVVNEQYCVIDYEMSSPRPRHDKDINVADGHIFVIVQGSPLTRSIEKNQRFIFNGQPYKFSAVQSLLDTNDDTNDTLLYMDMYLDMIQPDDDLVNGVANIDDYVYSINVESDVSSDMTSIIETDYNESLVNEINKEISAILMPRGKMVDGSGIIKATVYLNGNVVNRDVTWSCNEYATINDDGTYSLNGEVGDVATFTATLTDNPNISASCDITITDVPSILDGKSIIMYPAYNSVRQKQPITFEVYVYENGEAQDNEITWSYDGLDDSYFAIVQNEHTFTLHAKKISTTPLELTFSSQGVSKTISIMLMPLF